MNKILLILVGIIAVAGIIKYHSDGFSITDLKQFPANIVSHGQEFWQKIPADPEARKDYFAGTLISSLKQTGQFVSTSFAGLFGSQSATSSKSTEHQKSLLDSIPYSDQVIRGFDSFWDQVAGYAEKAWLSIIHAGFPNAESTPKASVGKPYSSK